MIEHEKLFELNSTKMRKETDERVIRDKVIGHIMYQTIMCNLNYDK